jgi:hypothetical protein
MADAVRILEGALDGRPWQDEAVDPVGAELASHLHAAYDADGVDRSLIRANLARTPEERLAELEVTLAFFESASHEHR